MSNITIIHSSLPTSRFGEYQVPVAVFIRQKMAVGSGVMTNLMKKVRKGKQQFHNSG